MENIDQLLDYLNLLAIFSGVIVGFVLGLIGSGGSVLAVPLLLYLVGMPSAHMAIGTSAFAVAINALVGLVSHGLKGNVKWRCAIIFTTAGIIGSYLGSSIGKIINGDILLIIFAFVMIFIASLMLKSKRSDHASDIILTLENAKILVPKLLAFGLLVGLAAGFFGIGGGFLIVPALIMALNLPIIYAIGTSLFSVTAFGLTTSLNYSSAGLVDWPIATQFIIGGLLGGIIGTMMATKLAEQKSTLTRIFAIILILMAVYMMYKSYINL